MKKFCEMHQTIEEAKEACQCDCKEPQEHEGTYYHCNYGNCCGYKCAVCGKFEVVNQAQED